MGNSQTKEHGGQKHSCDRYFGKDLIDDGYIQQNNYKQSTSDLE
jgi:hypothetical protein